MGEGAYLINPQAMHETIDGETIIIDLSTGTYYSLRGSAPAVWAALVDGGDGEAIVGALERVYDAAPGAISAAVESFLQQLEAVQLIAPGGDPAVPHDAADPAQRLPFEEPRLERYDDLQDVILLDPVHQVDDRGWPHPAPVGEHA
jgi:hypothetical protein